MRRRHGHHTISLASIVPHHFLDVLRKMSNTACLACLLMRAVLIPTVCYQHPSMWQKVGAAVGASRNAVMWPLGSKSIHTISYLVTNWSLPTSPQREVKTANRLNLSSNLQHIMTDIKQDVKCTYVVDRIPVLHTFKFSFNHHQFLGISEYEFIRFVIEEK